MWAQAEKTWGLKRLRAHREADAILRESIRIDPTQTAYHDNLRGNALSCRRGVVGNAVAAVAIGGAALAGSVVLFAWLFPALRRVDNPALVGQVDPMGDQRKDKPVQH